MPSPQTSAADEKPVKEAAASEKVQEASAEAESAPVENYEGGESDDEWEKQDDEPKDDGAYQPAAS